MAAGLPSLSDQCTQLSLGPGELCVRFPGGVTLCAQQGFDRGDANEIARSVLAQMNAALMPLAPFFTTLEFVKAVSDFAQGIPKAIASLSPQPIVEPLADIAKAVTKLLGMAPQRSVPVLIRDTLNLILVQLIGLRGEIGAMLAFQQRLAASAARAVDLGNAELQFVVDCATGNLAAQLANHNAAMAPLNKLLLVVNILLELASLPPIELLPGLGEQLSPEVLDVLDVTITVLEGALAAIPL